MQSSTGQYSTHAGEPAQPVQHSVITANSLGFFLRGVERPFERGSCFSSMGTIPEVLTASDCSAMGGLYSRPVFWKEEFGSPDQRFRSPSTSVLVGLSAPVPQVSGDIVPVYSVRSTYSRITEPRAE